jgi:hypothetical protein
VHRSAPCSGLFAGRQTLLQLQVPSYFAPARYRNHKRYSTVRPALNAEEPLLRRLPWPGAIKALRDKEEARKRQWDEDEKRRLERAREAETQRRLRRRPKTSVWH